jgi:glycosyltransferase involved in cell wall biosynthesis
VDLHPAVAAAAAGWVTACQLEDLTNTLATAITNPEIRQQRGKNARDLVLNQYSWSAIAEQMLTVYQDLVCDIDRPLLDRSHRRIKI